MTEYEETCMECGFNQSDNDEREKKEKQKLISEFMEDLKHLWIYIEGYEGNLVRRQISEKWEEKL